MDTRQELTVNEWLSPKSRDSLKDAVKRQVSSEVKERLLRNPGSDIDYGYSFPGLNCIKTACLKEVRGFYEATGKRARVADIGAGFGSMTWKLLAAGAEVDAFEIQKPTAHELFRRITDMNPYFWDEDNIEDILEVFPENALTTLRNLAFTEKYDFIWISQVLHFLTPDEIQQLSIIFQAVLKPGGRVFAEANAIHTFQSLDTSNILKSSYENAQKIGIKFPGFLTLNSATLINDSIGRVVDATLVTVYDQTEMEQYNIPYQTNAYGMGYLGPVQEDMVEIKFNNTKKKYPGHRFSINRFHQVMTLLDEETAKLCFNQSDVECISYHFDLRTGERLLTPVVDRVDYGFAVLLQKQPELVCEEQLSDSPTYKSHSPLVMGSLFNEPPHNQFILDIESNCTDRVANASLLEAIGARDYALALRKACAVGNLVFVKIILKYKNSLSININEQSTKNRFTALDWITAAKKVDFLTKERIISLLLRYDAESGLSEEITQKTSAAI